MRREGIRVHNDNGLRPKGRRDGGTLIIRVFTSARANKSKHEIASSSPHVVARGFSFVSTLCYVSITATTPGTSSIEPRL